MIVIDTHVWIWWINDDPKLKLGVRETLDTETDIRLSAISLLEIALATARGRLELKPSPDQWLKMAQSPQQLKIEPLTDMLAFSPLHCQVNSTATRRIG